MSDLDFERRIANALHAPVTVSDDARERIMHRVRESARQGPPRRSLPLAARSVRHSIVGLAMAASVGSVAVLSVAAPNTISSDGDRSSVIDDSLVSTLRDTLRFMRLVRDADRRYAVVVDGARWSPGPATTPVRADDRLVSLLHVARDSN